VRELRASLGAGAPLRREDLGPILARHFMEAARVVRPSVPQASLAAYEVWARDYAVTG